VILFSIIIDILIKFIQDEQPQEIQEEEANENTESRGNCAAEAF
jgi:hypothetical protein